jgi:hypothetical protein
VRSGARGALAGLACLAPLLGCASLGLGLSRALPDAGRECPGALVPTQQIAGEFLLRQRVRVQGEDLDWQLALVAQKRGDELILIGLDAFGGKQFVLTQIGSDVVVERPRGRLPFPPINLLRDWQRVRLPPRAEGVGDGVVLLRGADGAVIVEHARCGYRATFVAFEETPLPASGGGRP